MEFNTDIFKQFDQKWALLTAGKEGDFNTMTISWGGMGTLWSKPVVTVYIRSSRYTREFIDREDYFTVSFYPEEYKKVLGVLGSKSGRNMDKITASGLTAKKTGESISFEEAEVTLLCKKLLKQKLDKNNIVDTETGIKDFYDGDVEHEMYIGEVVDIIK